MKISDIGNNLNILITCDFIPHHGWMSFLSWYSIYKNLPESKVYIACNRKLMINNFFGWARRCNVPFVLHKQMEIQEQIDFAIKQKKIEMPILVVPAEFLCVRDFKEANFSAENFKNLHFLEDFPELYADCKSNNNSCFISYKDGWGKFNTSKWINNLNCPLVPEFKYNTAIMTANESKINQLWNNATMLYKGLA